MAGAQSGLASAHVDALNRLPGVTARQRDLEGIARAVHTELAPILRAPIWLVSMYNAATQTGTVVWQMHAGQELPGGTFPLGDGVTSRVLRSGRSMLIRQWSREGPSVRVQYATDGAPGLPESSVTVPIVLGREVLGVFSVQDYRPDAFDDRDMQLLEAAARLVAPAIDYARADTDHIASQASFNAASAGSSEMMAHEAELLVNGGGEILHCSHAARRLLEACGTRITFGQPLDSAIATTCDDRSGSIAHALARAVAQLKARKTPVTIEVPGREPGVTITIRSTLLPTEGGFSRLRAPGWSPPARAARR